MYFPTLFCFNFNVGGLCKEYGVFGVENGGYSYGFQGQEKDDEIKGEGNSVNYKYRMHDTRIGRFFAVDPLASKYPHNGPYNFSENIVIHAIELEGLEAFFIHGTNADPSHWRSGLVNILMKLTNNKTSDTGFSWKKTAAKFTNNSHDRSWSANRLVRYIHKNRVKGEEITLIGKSHGGNVAIQAAKKYYQKYGVKINIITIATPVFEGKDYAEDPDTELGRKAINDHIHLWNKIDGVQGGLSGEDVYTNSWTRNEEVYVGDRYSWWEWKAAHSFDYDNPTTIRREIQGTKESIDWNGNGKMDWIDKPIEKLDPVAKEKGL